MTLSITALAVIALVLLIVFSPGSRVRITFGALAGALIGVVGVVGAAFFGGLAHVGQAVLNAFQ